jgi:hypothetical protein
MPYARVIALLALVAALAASGCGGFEPAAEGDETASTGEPAAPEETAWLALVNELRLQPRRDKLVIDGSREGDELALTIMLPANAPAEVAFGDGLYGAQAYSFAQGTWERVDTADIRTLIAPLLKPGQSADVRLPVRDADSYRVLVPVEQAAAWADVI